ncbi:HTH_Tnp_Tc3_2 domain-containing protein [Trichonephila clavipes]|nr:HTH_Tnp_Tc3_2 domain-containing protein [Trichonephila clavipes]
MVGCRVCGNGKLFSCRVEGPIYHVNNLQTVVRIQIVLRTGTNSLIPSHVVIIGNEMADSLAKAVSLDSLRPDMPSTFSEVFSRTPTDSSAAIQAQVAPSLGAPVSSQTIRKRLAEGHLGSQRPIRVLPLITTHPSTPPVAVMPRTRKLNCSRMEPGRL